MQYARYPYKKKLEHNIYRGKTTWKYSEKTAIYKPMKEQASEGTKPANCLIQELEPPELWETLFSGLHHPLCGTLLW